MSEPNKNFHSRVRKSGLRKPVVKKYYTDDEIEYLLQQEELDNLKKDYATLLRERKSKKAYMVFFKDRPTLFYISFQIYEKRHVSRLVASKYFKNMYQDRPLNQYYWASQRKRVPAFDKYSGTEKVPIEELLKAGAVYTCSTCGIGHYSYEDVKNGNCFIIEGEGDVNPFTSGMLVCKECRKKFF